MINRVRSSSGNGEDDASAGGGGGEGDGEGEYDLYDDEEDVRAPSLSMCQLNLL